MRDAARKAAFSRSGEDWRRARGPGPGPADGARVGIVDKASSDPRNGEGGIEYRGVRSRGVVKRRPIVIASNAENATWGVIALAPRWRRMAPIDVRVAVHAESSERRARLDAAPMGGRCRDRGEALQRDQKSDESRDDRARRASSTAARSHSLDHPACSLPELSYKAARGPDHRPEAIRTREG